MVGGKGEVAGVVDDGAGDGNGDSEKTDMEEQLLL